MRKFKNLRSIKEAAAADYVVEPDDDEETTDYKPRSKKEIDFVDQHTTTIDLHPVADEDQFVSDLDAIDQVNAGSDNATGEEKPVKQGTTGDVTFAKFRQKVSQTPARKGDKKQGDFKTGSVKEEVELDEASKFSNADFILGFAVPWAKNPTTQYEPHLVNYVKKLAPSGNREYAYKMVAQVVQQLINGGMPAIRQWLQQNKGYYDKMDSKVKKELMKGMKEEAIKDAIKDYEVKIKVGSKTNSYTIPAKDELSAAQSVIHSIIARSKTGGSPGLAAIRKQYPDMKSLKKKGISVSDKTTYKEEVEFIEEAVKAGTIKLENGKSVKVTKEDAAAFNAVLKELNPDNRKRMESEMMKDEKSYKNMLAFAKRTS
jgi:bisphosphoglycerate-dependent phosphoglycerate mutase